MHPNIILILAHLPSMLLFLGDSPTNNLGDSPKNNLGDSPTNNFLT